jgi:VIT1/CCC1 family predicted Fe2+/Mn2+ transporter
MTKPHQPCRICQAGQRISTAVFAIFAVLLALAAMDPAETPLRQMALSLCASLSALAVLRFPIARLVSQLRPTRKGYHHEQ